MDDSIIVLREEYPGDEEWEEFVDLFRASWPDRNDAGRYLSSLGDEGLAIVLSAAMGEDFFSWFARPIGALAGRSAADVLRNEPDGETILKSLLMRMPLA